MGLKFKTPLSCQERASSVVRSLSEDSVDRGSGGTRAATKCSVFRRDLRRDVFKTGRQSLNRIYGVRVHAPDSTGMDCATLMRSAKEWMEGSDVRRAFRRCGRKEREGGRFSFRLLKKLLPAPCKCLRKSTYTEWVTRQTTPLEGEIDPAFYDCLVTEVARIFPEGWASNYFESIARNAPNTSSCVESRRKEGGSRTAISLDDYLAGVIGEREVKLKPFKYSEVLTAGKLRALTITPADMAVLRPLHKMLFARVSRQRWSLIGPPTPDKFKRAGFKFRTGILSGDYAGATDSLDIRVSSLILGAALSTAPEVPQAVKTLAMYSLLPDVSSPDTGDVFTVTRGQMMGSLLSFPLLCLYNRVCSIFALGRKVPMLINGDDLVAETSNPTPWFEKLPSLGLQPERSKSGYSLSRCEINSTPFLVSKGGHICPAPLVRARALLPRSAVASTFYKECETFAFEAGHMSQLARDVFFNVRGKVVIKAFHHGLDLADCGFRGDTAVSDATRWGLFTLLRQCALSSPLKAQLPSSPPSQNIPTIPCHAMPISVRSDNRKFLFGELFGRKFVAPDSEEARKEFWKVLAGFSCKRGTKPPVCRFALPSYTGTRFPRLYWGEPLPRSIYVARVLGRIAAPKPRDPLRLAVQLAARVPVSMRLGLVLDHADGAIRK